MGRLKDTARLNHLSFRGFSFLFKTPVVLNMLVGCSRDNKTSSSSKLIRKNRTTEKAHAHTQRLAMSQMVM